ncbi:MAG: ribonuclease R [Candidatus Aminicenantes bacterium]|jgi:ribonuclease R|nr:ribonuclease R [Candidatus Aminicenantes bacterium]
MENKIKEYLGKNKKPVSLNRLIKALNLNKKERRKLASTLNYLEKKGVLKIKGDRIVGAPKTSLIRGTFSLHPRGFGFITPESPELGTQDIFIPPHQTSGAITGDLVEVAIREKGRLGKPEGRIVRIIKRARPSLYGVFLEINYQPYVLPMDTLFEEPLALKLRGRKKPKPGQIVEVDRNSLELVRILGYQDEPGVDLKVVINQFNLEEKFSPEALREAAALPEEPGLEDFKNRVDYRNWATVTIDGEKAQDFDDAVSIRKLPNGNFLLGVHIADVSHYVRPGSALDREAYLRGTSVYFPDLTLPMLPEKLSNNLCSLRPRVPRLTVSAIMEIDRKGNIIKTSFHPSIIKTVERLTYTSVFKIFQGDSEEQNRYRQILSDLFAMRELAAILKSKRLKQGSLDFDLLEPELVYQEGLLTAVVPSERNEAHCLVEEFMLAANVAVARFLTEEGHPCLYRVHPAPTRSDLEKLRKLLIHFGVELPRASQIKSSDLQAVIESFRGKPEEKFITIQILRSLRLAVYSEENCGHFGLAQATYTHFTSPIRRYPDLIVHRLLKRALSGRKPRPFPLAEMALHCSQRERLADEAERSLIQWRILRILKDKLGEEFSGMITDINRAGLIVELDDYFIDGLIPYSALGDDYFLKKNEKTLRGRKSGVTFSLGDRVKVILVSCNPILKKVEFILAR